MTRVLPFLLCLLSGCGLFFPRGPYGRIPDLTPKYNSTEVAELHNTPLLADSAQQAPTELGQKKVGESTNFFKYNQTPQRTDFAPTPGGERRYIRALRAANTAPRKVKATGRATAQAGVGNKSTSTNGNKSATATDSAQVINAPKADNVAGPGATQTNIESSILSWRLLLLLLAAAAAGIAARRLTA